MSDVLLFGYAGADDLDFFGALSVLVKAQASIEGDFFKVAARRPTVKLASGVVVDLESRWVPLRDALATRAVVLPGGPGALAAGDDPELAASLRSAHARRLAFYSCCTGATLLGALGLLDGMHVAVHHLKRDSLANAKCAGCFEGLIRDRWLTSVAGDLASSVKSVDLATQLLRDLAPAALPPILDRMELAEGRRLRVPS